MEKKNFHNVTAEQLLEILIPAEERKDKIKLIKDPMRYDRKNHIKRLDSMKDHAFLSSCKKMDILYGSEVNVILHCSSYLVLNKGEKDESKKDIEFYIYRKGEYEYEVFELLEEIVT